MTATDALPTALDADGTPTLGFLIWEAELDFRIAARALQAAACSLRIALRCNSSIEGMPAKVLGLAEVRAANDDKIAARLDDYMKANQAFMDAAWKRAELDPEFDIRPFLVAGTR
ncbi:hypothetical protein [Streptosporangium sp. NPDC051022]|uniref:hypothetical protein n=1 Tax=Streptosporangium sp. NPDC051022 TaxID=3155752 RepID=UPI00342E5614